MAPRRPPHERELLGHPVGLAVLFSVEMWERFSYYGMRSLLVLYMRNELLLPGQLEGVFGASLIGRIIGVPGTAAEVQRAASTIYGLYTGCVYLTPLAGGFLADKLLGKRVCVVVGLTLMAAGHFLMVARAFFFVGLVLIVTGSGFFKPNMSVQLGGLYGPTDGRRDRAFSIFYMGVNLGGFLAPMVVGTVGDPEVLGYKAGFSLAGFGMCFGLLTYCTMQRFLPSVEQARRPAHEQPSATGGGLDRAAERRRVLALMLVCAFGIMYTIAYEQQGNTLQLFFDEHVDRRVGGFVMPSAWLQAINPILILTLTPIITRSWRWLATEPAVAGCRAREPETLSKMAIGNVLVGFSFLFLAAAGYAALPADAGGEERLVSFGWVLAMQFVITLGELHVQPVGLSFISRYAPAGAGSLMMGVWYTSAFAGSLLGGVAGQLYSILSLDVFYLLVAIGAMVNGVIMVAAVPALQRWVHDGNGEDRVPAAAAMQGSKRPLSGRADRVAEKTTLLP
jgi:POT family proton-dependent oligopeptide transporter